MCYVFGFELQLILLLEHICNAERTTEPQPAQKTTHTAGSTSKSQGRLPEAAFRDNKEREMDISLHRLFPRYPPVPLILLRLQEVEGLISFQVHILFEFLR